MDSPNRNKIINVKKRPYPRHFGECHASDMDTPKRARKNWSICKKKIKMQTIKIRNLQQAKSRLKARICSLNSLLKFLKKKYDLTETAQCIIHESAPGILGEICQRSRK
ncbi:uncharacterized protein LOC108913688 [Anoplophora glabripennis]|uniref:uncharacterized protein LOC108913688 n=1 Tax=Anoplophora glabripennis TaxID=217634 RepID=UPI0008747B9C|nr:uncharacterized protein LOC108913688 [Anoplophora glabripennis]